jgi:hypothetical protein
MSTKNEPIKDVPEDWYWLAMIGQDDVTIEELEDPFDGQGAWSGQDRMYFIGGKWIMHHPNIKPAARAAFKWWDENRKKLLERDLHDRQT